MTSRCHRCPAYAGRGYTLCQNCRVEKNNDFRTARDERDRDGDERDLECTQCGCKYSGSLSDDCPECGSRRCRYIGPIGADQEAVTDGGDEQLVPATIDYDDLIGEECLICGDEITPGSLRWNGYAWEHKSRSDHPQVGHHRISETLDSADLPDERMVNGP